MSDPISVMATLAFTADELDTLRVALLTAHYSALDEERVLARRKERIPFSSPEGIRVEDDRATAALRAFKYHLLVERVLAAAPRKPTGGDTPP